MAEKTITIRIDEGLHTEIKIQATRQGKTLKDYIVSLALKDLEENK